MAFVSMLATMLLLPGSVKLAKKIGPIAYAIGAGSLGISWYCLGAERRAEYHKSRQKTLQAQSAHYKNLAVETEKLQNRQLTPMELPTMIETLQKKENEYDSIKISQPIPIDHVFMTRAKKWLDEFSGKE